MEFLAPVIGIAYYLYDLANYFLKGIFTPVVCTFIYIGFAFSILQRHLDRRLDAIERRLDALRRPDYE
jgi:predicted PurR-regulated permease PerM